jgi:hypothetical protein
VNDWPPEAVDVLREVIDRMIPRDRDPSATDLGVDRYILHQVRSGAVSDRDMIRAGLDALSATIEEECRVRGVPRLSAVELDAVLRGVASAPWFESLIELAAEGYYADPGNGGNADARSWAMIGYEHRLPEGPDGPVSAEHPKRAARSRTGDAPDDFEVPRPAETAGHGSRG